MFPYWPRGIWNWPAFLASRIARSMSPARFIQSASCFSLSPRPSGSTARPAPNCSAVARHREPARRWVAGSGPPLDSASSANSSWTVGSAGLGSACHCADRDSSPENLDRVGAGIVARERGGTLAVGSGINGGAICCCRLIGGGISGGRYGWRPARRPPRSARPATGIVRDRAVGRGEAFDVVRAGKCASQLVSAAIAPGGHVDRRHVGPGLANESRRGLVEDQWRRPAIHGSSWKCSCIQSGSVATKSGVAAGSGGA